MRACSSNACQCRRINLRALVPINLVNFVKKVRLLFIVVKYNYRCSKQAGFDWVEKLNPST